MKMPTPRNKYPPLKKQLAYTPKKPYLAMTQMELLKELEKRDILVYTLYRRFMRMKESNTMIAHIRRSQPLQ